MLVTNNFLQQVPGRISNNDWTKYLKEEMDPPGFIVKKIDDKVGKPF